MTKWKKMKKAPKDGTPILALLDFKDGYPLEYAIIEWCQDKKFPWKFTYEQTSSDACAKHIPSCWRKLPKPPKKK